MKITLELDATGHCPIDGSTDNYTVTVDTDKTIMAEDLRGKVDALLAEPILQEDFTAALFKALPRVSRVRTRCFHSGSRVMIDCVVG